MRTSLSFMIGIVGNIFALLVFLSPLPTFKRIVRNRSVEEFQSLPFICTLLNASLWTYYGLTKPGSFIVVPVNGFGVVLELVYIAIFLKFAPPRMRRNTVILAVALNFVLLAAAILITHFMMRQSLRIDTIGALCVGLTIAMYGSPLAAMRFVVANQSVEYLPLLVSLFLFANGGVWTIYSVLTGDYFIGVPNGIGFILGAAQLILYLKYRTPSSSNQGSGGGAFENEPLVRASTDPEHVG